jgi:hypothetical protein
MCYLWFWWNKIFAPLGESTLWWYILGKKTHLFFNTFCIILGPFFFMSFSILKIIENGFLTQILPHNSCYLSNDTVFSKTFFVFTHLHLFECKTSSRCFLWNHMSGIVHIELKWDNELICNIWLSISSSLVITWIVFEVYLHFAIYRYDYNFFIYIIFNHLISISKVRFFLTILFFGFWSTSFQVLFAKNRFNISLVEVQKHVISKHNICNNNLWPL